MNITIKYGCESMNKSFTSQPTVGQVIDSASVRAELGYGDNVRALVNGVEQSDSSILSDGAILTLETRANSKATV